MRPADRSRIAPQRSPEAVIDEGALYNRSSGPWHLHTDLLSNRDKRCGGISAWLRIAKTVYTRFRRTHLLFLDSSEEFMGFLARSTVQTHEIVAPPGRLPVFLATAPQSPGRGMTTDISLNAAYIADCQSTDGVPRALSEWPTIRPLCRIRTILGRVILNPLEVIVKGVSVSLVLSLQKAPDEKRIS